MKKILLLLFAIPSGLFGQTPSSSIKGVVTYYFNQYQGDKPDIGAEVVIIDSATLALNELTIDSFHYANLYRNLANSYREMGSKVPYEVATQVNKYKADDDVFFKSLDQRNAIEFIKAKGSDQNYTATVDGSGNYIVNLRPATYYVFIISHNRTGLTMSEIMGKEYFKKVHLQADRSVNVSARFDLH